MKKNKIKEEGGFIKEKKNKSNVVGRLVVSLIITLMLIFALFIIKKSLSTKEEEYEVICSSQEIPENVVISDKNFTQYFTIKKVPVSILPQGCYRDKDLLNGLQVIATIPRNTIVTNVNFIKESDVLNTMDNPVVMGVALNNSSDGLNGTLRPGDIVDIVFCETKKTITIRNVYIVNAFDNSGVSIDVSNTSAIASKINVYIESDYVTSFAEHLKNCDVYISKINYDTKQRLFVPSDSDYEMNITAKKDTEKETVPDNTEKETEIKPDDKKENELTTSIPQEDESLDNMVEDKNNTLDYSERTK